MAACGVTLPTYTDTLSLVAELPFNWWMCKEADLITWTEPWVVNLLVKFPPARLHARHTSVNTLAGPLWVSNTASEGIDIILGKVRVTFQAATEHTFSDSTLANFFTTPTYGREVTLTSSYSSTPSGWVTKKAYLSTKDALGNPDSWNLISIVYTPGVGSAPGIVSLFVNHILIISNPIIIPTSNLNNLVLATSSIAPTPIQDILGEITLNQPWVNDGATEPNFAIVSHNQVAGYPSSYVGQNPVIGFFEIVRGSTVIPPHADLELSSDVTKRINSPLVNILTEIPTDLNVPLLLHRRGTTAYVSVTVVDDNGLTLPHSGSCNVWWDIPAGPIKLTTASMVQGHLETSLNLQTLGFGWLRVENLALNMGNGYSYPVKNSLPLEVTL